LGGSKHRVASQQFSTSHFDIDHDLREFAHATLEVCQ
jgi:hypothetical protein